MIINFENLCNHSPGQSNNIVCLRSYVYKKEEEVWKQKMYDMGYDFLVDVVLFNSAGNSYTVAKIQF